MKKLLIYSFSILAFVACEEGEHGLFDKKDKPCPTVATEDVPTAVKTAQERDYAGIAVTTWFNVDGKYLCSGPAIMENFGMNFL